MNAWERISFREEWSPCSGAPQCWRAFEYNEGIVRMSTGQVAACKPYELPPVLDRWLATVNAKLLAPPPTSG